MSQTETVTLTRLPTKATAGEVAPQPAEPVTIPKNLGPVQLLREIGKGGMGSVWLGHHELLRQDVAVKFLLNMVRSEDDPGFATFLEGARAAAALRHKGLNAVLNADVIEGVPFIVMDYVEGPTLAQLLEQPGTLSPAIVRIVLEAACEAVGELHDHGIVHRDIKPSNILLASDGTPVLTDFGLACTRPAMGFGACVEGVAGTPCYMAPEMFDRSVSARSDVYALGVMAYELLMGHVPFDGTLDDVRRGHRDVPVPLDPIREIHPALAELIDRAMNKNPMYRLKSARHMAHAVEEAFAQIDQMRVAKAKGQAELSAMLTRWARGEPVAAAASDSALIAPTSYYDRLGTLVIKRKEDSGSGSAIPSDDLFERIATDTPCVRCGTPLKGEPLTGRCPGCLLLVKLTTDPQRQPASGAVTPQSGSNLPAARATQPTDAPAPQPPATPMSPESPESPSKSGLLTRFRRAWDGFWGQ